MQGPMPKNDESVGTKDTFKSS